MEIEVPGALHRKFNVMSRAWARIWRYCGLQLSTWGSSSSEPAFSGKLSPIPWLYTASPASVLWAARYRPLDRALLHRSRSDHYPHLLPCPCCPHKVNQRPGVEGRWWSAADSWACTALRSKPGWWFWMEISCSQIGACEIRARVSRS